MGRLFCNHLGAYTLVALSLTVIPVLWAMSRWCPAGLWFTYLIESASILLLHRIMRAEFRLNFSA